MYIDDNTAFANQAVPIGSLDVSLDNENWIAKWCWATLLYLVLGVEFIMFFINELAVFKA